MTLMTLHKNTIKILPNGYVLWPGDLVPFKSTPITPEIQEASTIRALAAVHGAKDDLPEKVRQAADNFTQAAVDHLSNKYGEGMTVLIPNELNAPIFPNPPESDSCATILQRLEFQVNVLKRLPESEVPGWKASLLSCFRQGSISEEAYRQGLALL
jgi:hypothetical protein